MCIIIVSVSQKHATNACVIPEVLATATVELEFCLMSFNVILCLQ